MVGGAQRSKYNLSEYRRIFARLIEKRDGVSREKQGCADEEIMGRGLVGMSHAINNYWVGYARHTLHRHTHFTGCERLCVGIECRNK